MADRENTAVNAVQVPALEPSAPTLAVDARSLELSKGYHPVLPRRDVGNNRVRVGLAGFCIHVHA
jgi:hypothetical protein